MLITPKACMETQIRGPPWPSAPKKTLIRTPPKKTSAGTPCGISAVNKGALSLEFRLLLNYHL